MFKEFTCNYCSFWAITERSLKVHLAKKHKDKKELEYEYLRNMKNHSKQSL